MSGKEKTIYKLYYRDDDLGLYWFDFFENCEDVQIIEGDILHTDCRAIVSPANSFGFMDGGLDYALSEKFGWGLQERLQEEIKNTPMGELLIGQALVMPTGDTHIPYLISAPTMRVPMSFNIATSVNAYLAMKAILVAVKDHTAIESVAIPGLCTGVGRMPPAIAARQMYAAYNEIVRKNRLEFKDFGVAQKYHWYLNEDGVIYE